MRQLQAFLGIASLVLCNALFAQSGAPAQPANRPIPSDLTAQAAGTIDLVAGDARVLPSNKPEHVAKIGDAIREGDTLITGANGEIHVTMADSGFIALRPDTRMQVASYKADGGADDHGVFKLIQGGMRSITGWIGKYNRTAYTVQTPTATIGIRGTDHETRYIAQGSSDGAAGTYEKVFIGETVIATSAGETHVKPDTAGFDASDSGQQPRLLASVPAFFKPGPNEALINEKHAQIQKIIEDRRTQRQKVVEQLRAAFAESASQLKIQSDANRAAGLERSSSQDAQKLTLDQKRAALRARENALQDQRQIVAQLRQKLFGMTSSDVGRYPAQTAQMKMLRDKNLEVRKGFDDLRDERKALMASNFAAADARRAAVEEHRQQSDQRLAAIQARLVDLQARQKALEQAGQTVRDGFAKTPEGTPELAAMRKANIQAADQLIADRKIYDDDMNALFEDNIGFSEKNISASTAQRQNTETRIMGFEAREKALNDEQVANDLAREKIQENAVADPERKARVHELISTIHTALDAIHDERDRLQGEWKAVLSEDLGGVAARQAATTADIQAIRSKHAEFKEKLSDLEAESIAMQKEIRSLQEQEQKRYLEELRAARQQQNSSPGSDDS